MSPVEHVLLYVRSDLEGWRYDSWKAAIGYVQPQDPPQSTLGLAFPTLESAATFFTSVLTNPQDVMPSTGPPMPGLMPPGPETTYYWPPPLEHCVETYENDLLAQEKDQLPVRRVLILGAGFSADFQFVTSNTIVGTVESFFRNWQPSDWYRDRYRQLTWWLDSRFPNWRNGTPSLYEFLTPFFRNQMNSDWIS